MVVGERWTVILAERTYCKIFGLSTSEKPSVQAANTMHDLFQVCTTCACLGDGEASQFVHCHCLAHLYANNRCRLELSCCAGDE